jgi:predicted dienelactone hydrolase
MTDQTAAYTLADLSTRSRVDLKADYEAHFGTVPPSRMRDPMLRRAVGYALQVEAAGGPDKALERRLDRMAADYRRTGTIKAETPPTVAKPGTRLLREWRGVTHSVTVTDDGVVWNGETYPSLSAVARAITGTRWSGPVFFGFKKRAA